MRKLLVIIGCTVMMFAHAQKNEVYIKASAGRLLFGTGDIRGYGVNLELSTPLTNKTDNYLQHFHAGVEACFEAGATQPVVQNPTAGEFQTTFYQVSNTTLYPKLTYYPLLHGFLKGLNVAIGPTAGYSLQSTEQRVTTFDAGGGEIYRESFLQYRNAWLVGYRVSVGYEYLVKNRVLIGMRLDFANYQNGDINTLAGIKAGVRL